MDGHWHGATVEQVVHTGTVIHRKVRFIYNIWIIIQISKEKRFEDLVQCADSMGN